MQPVPDLIPETFSYETENNTKYNVCANIELDYTPIRSSANWDCQRLQELYKLFAFKKYERYRIVDNVPDQCLPNPNTFPNLGSLEFDRFQVYGYDWSFLGKYSNLRSLSISNTQFELSVLSKLTTTRLFELTLINCNLVVRSDYEQLSMDDIFKPLESLRMLTIIPCDPNLAEHIVTRTELKFYQLQLGVSGNLINFSDMGVLHGIADTSAQIDFTAPFGDDMLKYFPYHCVFKELTINTTKATGNEAKCIKQAFEWLLNYQREDVEILTVFIGSIAADILTAVKFNVGLILPNVQVYNLRLLKENQPREVLSPWLIQEFNEDMVTCTFEQVPKVERVITAISTVYSGSRVIDLD